MTLLSQPSFPLPLRTHSSLCQSSSPLSVMQSYLLLHSHPTNVFSLFASYASQNILSTSCLTPSLLFLSPPSDTFSREHSHSSALCIKDRRDLQDQYDIVKQDIMLNCSSDRNRNQCEIMVKSGAWKTSSIIKVTQHNKTMTSIVVHLYWIVPVCVPFPSSLER